MKLLVTGGAGFIGSNFIRYLLTEHPEAHAVNLDKLTYAGNLDNLAELSDSPRYRFVQGDIADAETLPGVFEEKFDAVINFAAETHVDRSIEDAAPFLRTNVLGTHVLLEAARRHGVERFVQISTDEVYGSAPDGVCFAEDAPLRPSSPYAASKAAADHLVMAYVNTYGLPALILRGTNNYGPYQFPEKLIPLMIAHALQDKPLPVYGDGLQERDWLYVEDYGRAIWLTLERGKPGEVYNVASGAPQPNVKVVQTILQLLGKPLSLMKYVEDRPGHDRRYALDSTKLRTEVTKTHQLGTLLKATTSKEHTLDAILKGEHRKQHQLDVLPQTPETIGWSPRFKFEEGLERTVEWYRSHGEWLRRCQSGAYRDYYQRHYEQRAALLARVRTSRRRGERR